MRLLDAHVTLYRSVEDSDLFQVEENVTCLVGKNESGKTAVLQALYKLNPIEKSATFDEVIDFPSRLTRQRRQTEGSISSIRATFELSNDELAAIEEELGEGFIERKVTVTHGYRFKTPTIGMTTHEDRAVAHLTKDLELPDTSKRKVAGAKTIAGLLEELSAIEEAPAAVTALATTIRGWRDESLRLHLIDEFLWPWLPNFVYFDDYSNMPGKVSIPDLIRKRDDETLMRGERALLALLSVVGVDLEDFQSIDKHERLIRETENAANSISDEVFEYWSQNKNLDVELEILQPETGAEPPLNEGPILEIRVKNQRHRVSVPFDERSRGFVWFFSFLAYFSELEEASDRDLILLLDEPGMSLHATAQGDLLRLIDERLAPKHQVLYTTHSPFLVDPHRLARVRTVVDVDNVGTKVSSDVLRADDETVFPMQAALGYDLAQSLFVGPDNLLLEGPSDLIYLDFLSDALTRKGRTGLDPRWIKVPVGGMGKLSTFVALLGANKLNVAVLMDASTQGAQAVERLRDSGRLDRQALVTVGDVVGRADADIEDLFDDDLFLELVNSAYASQLAKPLKVADIKSKNPRLVKRLEEVFAAKDINGGRLVHYTPAAALLRNVDEYANKLSDDTLERAEELFRRFNARLP